MVGLGPANEGDNKIPCPPGTCTPQTASKPNKMLHSAKGKRKRGAGSTGQECRVQTGILHRAAEGDLTAEEPLGKDQQEVNKQTVFWAVSAWACRQNGPGRCKEMATHLQYSCLENSLGRGA